MRCSGGVPMCIKTHNFERSTGVGEGELGRGEGSAGGGAHLSLSGGGASSPEKPEPRSTGEGWELPEGLGALAPVQAASCWEGAAGRAPQPLLLGLCRFLYRPAGPLPPATGSSLPGTCQHLPREGTWLRKSRSGTPTRPWCLTPEHGDLSGGAQALGKPSAAWNRVHVRFLTLQHAAPWVPPGADLTAGASERRGSEWTEQRVSLRTREPADGGPPSPLPPPGPRRTLSPQSPFRQSPCGWRWGQRIEAGRGSASCLSRVGQARAPAGQAGVRSFLAGMSAGSGGVCAHPAPFSVCRTWEALQQHRRPPGSLSGSRAPGATLPPRHP